MASGARPAWHVPVLVLAGLLVVAQVVAFIVIRKNRKEASSQPATNVAASTPIDANDSPMAPPPDAHVAEVALADAAEPIAPVDATAVVVDTVEHKQDKQDKPKKPTRAELLAQQKKDREEKKRDDEQRARQEQAERDRDRKKAEQDKAAEQARLADVERLRLLKDKAEAEAATAKAAAEKARIEAAAKQTAAAEPKVDVLVFVLGPSTPSMSTDQIRNVYLGRASVWPNGTTARPLNRPAGTAAARKFYGGILKMSAGAYVEHWSEIQLSGGGIAPNVVSSGKTLVAKVAATSGGFGYVMESELPAETSGVRLVRLK